MEEFFSHGGDHPEFGHFQIPSEHAVYLIGWMQIVAEEQIARLTDRHWETSDDVTKRARWLDSETTLKDPRGFVAQRTAAHALMPFSTRE